MTQQKIDELFSLRSSSTRSGKRSRVQPTTIRDDDDFDDLFETVSSSKRRRTNNAKPVIETPSTKHSLKKKRSATHDEEETKAIDDLFTNTRKKVRQQIKTDESTDPLDMFKAKTNANIPAFMDDFKTPIPSKSSTTQKKFQMFFDDTDLIASREDTKTQEYTHIKPILVTSGQWLSKDAETKSTCETLELTTIDDDQRNLMHIQYAPLIVDDRTDKNKSHSFTRKASKKLLDGKSFHKQLVLSDSNVVRKENLQSCYNALLEDINKPRQPSTSQKSPKEEPLSHSDDEQSNHNPIDFFDFSNRKKKTTTKY